MDLHDLQRSKMHQGSTWGEENQTYEDGELSYQNVYRQKSPKK
jgi:hypothetical protein